MNKTAAFSGWVLLVSILTANVQADATTEERATKMLLEACPRLVKLQQNSELLSLAAKRMRVQMLDMQDLGWKEIVQIEVVLASSVKSLPRDFYASGQVCRYYVGHGGVITAKSSCKKICDFDPQSQGAAYLPLPASKSLQLAID